VGCGRVDDSSSASPGTGGTGTGGAGPGGAAGLLDEFVPLPEGSREYDYILNLVDPDLVTAQDCGAGGEARRSRPGSATAATGGGPGPLTSWNPLAAACSGTKARIRLECGFCRLRPGQRPEPRAEVPQ
jgi:hypothetical protein